MLSDSKKIDILWKKLFYVAAETDPGNKDGMNETTSSGIILLGNSLWKESNLIPKIPPAVDTDQVKCYVGVNQIKLVRDPTVIGNRSWYAVYPGTTGRATNWVPPSLGQDYLVRVNINGRSANPLATDYEWIFDYSAGVLTFVNCVPADVLALDTLMLNDPNKGIFLEGYVYQGLQGTNDGTIYEISGTVFGKVVVNDVLQKFVAATPFNLSPNLVASKARCAVRPSTFVEFLMFKNGERFGKMVFPPENNFGYFNTAAVKFLPGDELTVLVENLPDPNFGNCGWTIVADVI